MDLSKNRNSPANTEIEKGPAWIRRARLLNQIELRYVDLTDEQSAVVDQVCELLPTLDVPEILQHVSPTDRAKLCGLLRQLPERHSITRFLNQ